MDHWLAPSSSPSVFETHHDVFLSFRGKDTRNNFTGHLYGALQSKRIRTFIDDEQRWGEEISPSLIKAIRGSKISIIIFSKNYASSSLCLDELVEILECQESLGQLVWPVFFHVDPFEVRKHRNSFGEALTTYEKTEKEEKMPKWKLALTEAANLSGWLLDEGNDEYRLIQQIVEHALKELNRRRLLHVAEYTVGIESYLAELGPLIDVAEKEDVRFIGLCGMGGVGKTTIAEAVFNIFADEFEGSSFLADVRETSKQHLGMVKLQEMLLFDILGYENIKFGDRYRGINILRNRLRHKRVLLVLDNVDDQDQLETLAGGHEWFGLGSRIIITTRNKHLLTTHGADGIYEVQGLNHERALQLFSWNAFKRDKPVDEHYLTLSNRIVRYASGLPLALVLLGSFLCGRTEDQWQSAIHNFEKKLDSKLYEILKISYDVLREDEKALFLDIACFFVGEDKDYVIKALGSSNFSPIIGIGVLSDMSLINVDGYNKLRMHKLIEEMGKEIVRRESSKAGRCSRLWSPDDIFHIFSENTGTNWIQGIILKLPEKRTLNWNAKSFRKMNRLQILILVNVVLSTAIGYLPNELRLIDLPGYKFPTLPFHSGPKQLVILNMPHNHILQLGKGFKDFERLKDLNFSDSKFLEKIPDLSTAPNLESLRVGDSASLVEIHESVGFLTKLVTLDAQHCSSLRTVPSKLVSKYLTTLNFQGCPRLKIFPILDEKIEFLRINLSGTGIKELPSSVDRMVALKGTNPEDDTENIQEEVFQDVQDANLKDDQSIFWRRDTEDIKNIQEEVFDTLQPLSKRQKLNFWHAFALKFFKNLRAMPELMKWSRSIHTHGTESFPNWGGYGSFSCLVKVDLVCCKSCYCLPPLGQLPSLKKLHIQGLDRVERIGDEFYSAGTLSLSKPFKSLESLTFSHMLRWKEWSFMKSGVFSDLKQLTLDNCRKLKGMCFPNYLPSLKSLLISGCKQEVVASLSTDGLPLLSFLKIGQCKELKSFPIRALPANVDTVNIMGCKELVSLSEDGWPSKLKSLEISYCGKLFGNSLWWNLRTLTSLTSLQIIKIDEVVDSFPEEWQLPTTLKSLTLSHFRNLKSLNGEALQHHTSLKELKIEFCHHLHYLPEEGLPDSLSQLEIFGCGFLNRRCQKDRGEDWPKISHIPHIRIDCKEI